VGQKKLQSFLLAASFSVKQGQGQTRYGLPGLQ
jgi:hypothetical protein